MSNNAPTNPLLATKSFDQIHSEHNTSLLKRALGPWQLALLGVGGTIGTGIFVLTGLEAAQHAGPAIVISLLLAGLGSLFAGLCYAEFSAMVPLAGSAYTYSYATLGEFAAWFIGWDLLLEYAVAAGTVSVGWSRYFVKFLHQYGVELPAVLTAAPFRAVAEGSMTLERTGAFINLPAFIIAFVAAGICYVGISESARVNAFVVMLKIAVILAVIGFGAFYMSGANWHPYIPPNTGEWGNFGWSGILRASGVIFFAYIGFDAVSTTAQEARNPQKDVPFGLLMGLAICALLYILMAAVLTGLLPYPQLNDAAPVAVALEAHPQLRWLAALVVPGALMGLTSVILVLILGQARILLAMSGDGLLPAFFGAVHPRFRTPHKATLITGLFAALLGGLFPIGILSELVSIGTLLAFVMVCLGVLVLRYTKPAQPRPFRVLWPWFTCLAGTGFCAVMAASLPSDTWIRLVIWAVLGILIYAFYGRHHSKLRQQNLAK